MVNHVMISYNWDHQEIAKQIAKILTQTKWLENNILRADLTNKGFSKGL